MAPIATADLFETVHYDPSTRNLEKLKPFLTTEWTSAEDSKQRPLSEQGTDWKLTDGELEEIETTLRSFQGQKLPLSSISPLTFPLPSVSRRLHELSQKLERHEDYFLLSGLKPEKYTSLENIIIQSGICSHVGERRGMAGGEGGDKNVIHHITPLPISLAHQTYHGPPNQTQAMPFHSDVGQIVSLYTHVGSAEGGRFYLASTSEIVEKIQSHCPELLDVLKEPWTFIPTSHQAEESPVQRPLLFTDDNRKPVISCSRARLTGTTSHPRPRNLPELTKEQILALDALHYFGHAVAKPFDFKAGDLLFFNNMTTMHARDKFSGATGGPRKKSKQRHLTRLIIRDEQAPWYVPDALRDEMRAVYDHDPEDEYFQIEKALFSWEASH